MERITKKVCAFEVFAELETRRKALFTIVIISVMSAFLSLINPYLGGIGNLAIAAYSAFMSKQAEAKQLYLDKKYRLRGTRNIGGDELENITDL